MNIIRYNKHAVYIHGTAHDNVVGSASIALKRNVIAMSGQSGVYIQTNQATTNTISGNYIGLNPVGKNESFGLFSDWGNEQHGISVWTGNDNKISYNLVGNNGWSRITFDAAQNGIVLHNKIGIDRDGEDAGNGFYGVHINTAAGPQVISNTIAHNLRGIHIAGGSDPYVINNLIHNNSVQYDAYPYGGGILVTGSGTDAVIHNNQIMSNTAVFGCGIAITDGAEGHIFMNTIRANEVYSSGHFSAGGGGIYVNAASPYIQSNQIISNSVDGDQTSSIIYGGGIYLAHVVDVWVFDNNLLDNNLFAVTGGGGGIAVMEGEKVIIQRNVIQGNHSDTSNGDGSAIQIRSYTSNKTLRVSENFIAQNAGESASIYALWSENIEFWNNLVVKNYGHGILLSGSTVDMKAKHNTISHNTDSGIRLNSSYLDLDNSIVSSNGGYGFFAQVTYHLNQHGCDFWGNTSGHSNVAMTPFISANPLFLDPDEMVFSLRLGSPCLDVADPSYSIPWGFYGTLRPQGPGPDIGAIEMRYWFLPLVRR